MTEQYASSNGLPVVLCNGGPGCCDYLAPDRLMNYHSDAIFLMGIDSAQAMRVFDPREGVDSVWPGDGVIYSQRLSAQRTKSRLSKIVGTPVYQSMTIRNWNTTTTLLKMLEEVDARIVERTRQ